MTKRKVLFFLSLIYGCWLLGGCSSDPSGPVELSTWETIQHEVLAANCVGCHTPGTSFARQSGLVLTPDLAYSQLVGVEPRNRAAATDGLMRVSTEGLAGLSKSYFWEKINVSAQDHFYSGHPYYGEIMPLGRAPLTNGQLEFIRQWIQAGAPAEGVVADLGLLTDDRRFDYQGFAPLAPPPDGIQLRLEPFDVAAHFEREVYTYLPLDNAEDIFVNRFEISLRPGTHHFILNKFPENMPRDIMPEPYAIRDLRDEQGNYTDAAGNNLFDWRIMQYQTPVVISQSQRMDFRLPPGVAFRLSAASGLDLNAHYANYSNTIIQGESYANLHLVTADQVEHEAEIFALSNFDIELPAGKTTTLVKEFLFKEDRYVFQLVSHTHDHMVEFTAELIGGPRDGELLYVSYDWEHPAPLRFDPPLFMERGQGFRISATYDNQTDRDLYFGFTRKEEMMILYGYYYAD